MDVAKRRCYGVQITTPRRNRRDDQWHSKGQHTILLAGLTAVRGSQMLSIAGEMLSFRRRGVRCWSLVLVP